MTNGKKVIGLIILLAIPVAILIFLELFGQHHYNIPIDPAEAEGLSAEVPPGYLGQRFSLPTSLLNATGERWKDSSETAKIVYFTPSSATDTAHLIFEKLTQVQDIFENKSGVLMLTLVPTERIDSLQALTARYRSQPHRWQWLASLSDSDGRKALPSNATAATLLLVDQNRRVRGYYDGMQEKEVDRLIAETRILLYDVE